MQEIKHKMRNLLILIILLAIITLTSAILAFVYMESIPLLSSILLLAALVVVVFLLNRRQEFEYQKHQYYLVGLIANKNQPQVLNKKILNQDFYKYLSEELTFIHYLSNNSYTIYYKVDAGLSKKKNRTLYALVILNKNVTFIDDTTTKAFESLEQYLQKKVKYRQRVFYVFKDIKRKIDKNAQTDADHVFFLNDKKNNIILFNVVYNSLTNEVYFLHSNNFRPSIFINKPLDYINDLIKYNLVK